MKSGDRVGPYEIQGLIGAGGMGEVFRAKDSRLGREVAIKVLPSAFASEQSRMQRFEQEARAAGMLNHPNIMSIYDIGMFNGVPYAVSELLEGENLRIRLADASLPPRKALDYGLQIAHGLAAAHEKGIVHRDLKPENVFITRDGRVKILDFGLAKLTQFQESDASALPTSAQTESGVVLGTAGYMSPEQVRGRPIDHRSDIFAFGAILYEMLTGQRAFRGDSAVETMNAILKQDPPEIKTSELAVSPAVDRVIKHCLEKNPEERFQSAHDLAFALETLSGPAITAPAAVTTKPDQINWIKWLVPFILIAAGIGAYLMGRSSIKPEPQFQRLTFQRGTIYSGHFAQDGRSILYSADWNATSIQAYLIQPGIPEAARVNLDSANILSVSPSGEMLVNINQHFTRGYTTEGMLGRVPISGGTPRQLLEHVQAADWHPKNGDFAVVHNARFLEYPQGKKIYEAKGWIGGIRFSPDGKFIALMEHSSVGDNAGKVSMINLEDGSYTPVTKQWGGLGGIDIHPKTREIWFSAGDLGNPMQIYAVNAKKKLRKITNVPLNLTLNDISQDGKVLANVNHQRRGISALPPGEIRERDLSWFDWSFLTDLTPDGKQILFMEQAEGVKQSYSAFLRFTDGSPAVRLGPGWSQSLSEDGKYALVISHPANTQLTLIPTGPGSPVQIQSHNIKIYTWAGFVSPKRLIFLGEEDGNSQSFYYQDIPDGRPQKITDDPVSFPWAVSPDGSRVAAFTYDGKVNIYQIQGGASENFSDLNGLVPIEWDSDQHLYLSTKEGVPVKIYVYDLNARTLTIWKELSPPDPTGVQTVGPALIAPNVNSYAYTYRSVLSDLYLITGLH